MVKSPTPIASTFSHIRQTDINHEPTITATVTNHRPRGIENNANSISGEILEGPEYDELYDHSETYTVSRVRTETITIDLSWTGEDEERPSPEFLLPLFKKNNNNNKMMPPLFFCPTLPTGLLFCVRNELNLYNYRGKSKFQVLEKANREAGMRQVGVVYAFCLCRGMRRIGRSVFLCAELETDHEANSRFWRYQSEY